MKEATQLSPLIRFEVFEVNLRTGELCKSGNRIRLPEQSFQILALLLGRPGQLLTREEIRQKLWPNDTIVEFENSINAAVKKLRIALEDSADKPRYVETLARRGYRWLVPVERVEKDRTSNERSAAAQAELAPSNLTGKKVSHYRVLEILGGGGMGVVYKAEDLKLGRRVALKFLPEELTNDRSAMERFEREARAASALNHPNICTIHAVDQYGGRPFIVMELLEGRTLRDVISATPTPPQSSTVALGSPLPLETLLDVAIQTVAGMEAAHKKGIIHRDIKPANIFITPHGQAKILDFGLAKLQESESPGFDAPTTGLNHFREGLDLTLTQTGVAMGTAGYMSPEQVRGEKLDARTDLFSFGLVLYEMAAGQRAFSGETAAIVHGAILNQTPIPVRELNSKVPARLQDVIGKSLQKDRELRYQSAAALSTDLKTLREQTKPRKSRWWWIPSAAIVVLLLVSTFIWVSRRTTSLALPQVRQTPLTINSTENAVTSGAISPDGSRLAYVDAKGLHIRSIGSGETRSLHLPEQPRGRDRAWQVVSWLDGKRFIANGRKRGLEEDSNDPTGTSIWGFSATDEAPRELRENAYACDSSRDGSFIAFDANKGRLGSREIWVMGSAGENARKLYSTDKDSALNCGAWSPDGRRLLYVEIDKLGARFVNRDLEGGAPVVVLESADEVNSVAWAPDGRLIYSKFEPAIIGNGNCNFWQMRLDERTGRPLEKARLLTSWSGFCMNLSAFTADGKKLSFLKWKSHFATYLAELDGNGDRVANAKRFTLTETYDQPLDWTPDGKTLIFLSNRNGDSSTGIYQQSPDEENPHLLLVSQSVNWPRVTPDGKWLLYVDESPPKNGLNGATVKRLPLSSGEPEFVASVRPNSRILCARSLFQLCAIAQPSVDREQAIVSSLDPVKGVGAELTRFPLDPNEDGWFLDLSPDGKKIAELNGPADSISVLPLRGGTTRQLRVKGWTNLHSVRWAADGKGFLVGSGPEPGILLHVDHAGNAKVLWEHASTSLLAVSPDGHHLAIADRTMDRNMWMMENF